MSAHHAHMCFDGVIVTYFAVKFKMFAGDFYKNKRRLFEPSISSDYT